MAEIRTSYFLEDAMQESFILALVERVATELSLSPGILVPDVRNATGGKGVVKTELRKFLRDVQREKEQAPDVLVVAIDSNCQGYTEKRNEIESLAQRTGYSRPLVCAVPDPHIERWYLEDTAALQQVLQSQITPQTPPYKCERGRYKRALGQTFADAGIFPVFGGSEYGKELAQSLDFYKLEKADAAFKHFVDSLKQALSPFCSQT